MAERGQRTGDPSVHAEPHYSVLHDTGADSETTALISHEDQMRYHHAEHNNMWPRVCPFDLIEMRCEIGYLSSSA